jgi:hypothetical protein
MRKMEVKIEFNGTMKIDVGIDELMHSALTELIEEYIKYNTHEVLNSIITVTEIDSKEE